MPPLAAEHNFLVSRRYSSQVVHVGKEKNDQDNCSTDDNTCLFRGSQAVPTQTVVTSNIKAQYVGPGDAHLVDGRNGGHHTEAL